MPNKRLGKGLEALITSYSTENDRYLDGAIPIEKIVPNRNQPRQEFNLDQLSELALSIESSGILQPLTVREMDNGTYELIAGERRLRAAKEIGLETVPVYILSIDADIEMMEYALVENVQRVDLNPLEEAEGYAILSGKYGLSQDEIARRVGKSRPTITNSLRLLKLPPEIKNSVKSGKISAGHARALLGLKKSLHMISIYKKIIQNRLSVRQTEVLVKKHFNTKSNEVKIRKSKFDRSNISNIENELISYLGTKVVISSTQVGKGKIQIEYYSKEDLQRILEIIFEN